MDLMAKILERESSNSEFVYIYKEYGKWVVYDRSALRLNKQLKNLMIVCHVINGAFWLPKAEVDMNRISEDCIFYRTDMECILKLNK